MVYMLVLSKMDGTDSMDSILMEYQDLYEVFSEKLANELSDHRI